MPTEFDRWRNLRVRQWGPAEELELYLNNFNRNKMDAQSQQKVINAGFTIIRSDDQPTPRIKFKGLGSLEWKTLEKFSSKAERDRKMGALLEMEHIIAD